MAERRSKQHELDARYRLILDTAGEGIFGIDSHGNHTFVNPAAARMLGWEAEELLGKPSHATWHYKYPNGKPYPEKKLPNKISE